GAGPGHRGKPRCCGWSVPGWRTSRSPPAGDQRADRQGSPDLGLPAHRRRRPDPGSAVGRPQRPL
ncbi:MAG: hypothetical protein AVDCRST_MAG24-1855, partial [uncultured Nocardioidaceae bacterium]